MRKGGSIPKTVSAICATETYLSSLCRGEGGGVLRMRTRWHLRELLGKVQSI